MTHRFRSTVPTGAACLVMIVGAGCRREQAQPTTAAGKPVQVTISRDNGRAARASIPVSGGTLTATGTDGTRFTLTIPPKALDGDSTITMIPVSAIEGLPLSGGLVGAVQFEPEGLRFNTPVELRIEPHRDVPVDQQVGFGYLGGGKDLHLYPLDRGRALAMRLLHFSGVGVAAGTQADVRALQQTPPADPTARLEQQIAEVMNAERTAQLTGGQSDPEFAAKLSSLLQDFYDHVVVPKIDAAKSTDSWRVMFDAVQTGLYFARISEMVGEDTEALSKLLPIMEPILVRGFDRAYHRCIQKLGGDKESGMLMIVARNAALTIFQVDASDPRFSQSKIDECFRGGSMLPDSLELSFQSAFLYQFSGAKATMTLGSTLKLIKTAGTTTYDTRDWTPLVYRDLDITAGSGCTSYSNVKANDGSWRVELMVHPDGMIGMAWSFNALNGVPTEQMTIVPCPGSGGHSHDSYARWWWACLNQISSQDVQQAMEQGQGYVGLATGMRLWPAPGILTAHIERKDFLCQQGVISLGLKVLP
jgi:hypothetical protein